ncbi:hypothetical protein [Thermoactinospora rubra]|uniref:hypothetical protein n=1 Tax=Thermoactinospora rubra TaxID=1088767 RepID=UPI000A11DFDA|nr:hypothetical protein [Thermoactinospora rubra]
MTISIEARVTRLESDVMMLRAHADQSDRTSQLILAALTRLEEGQDSLRAGQEVLSSQVGELTTRVDGLTTQVGELTTRVDGLTVQVGDLTTRVDGLTTRVDGLTVQVGELGDRMTVVERSVGGMERSLKQVQEDVAEIKAGHIELRNLVAGLVK